MPRRRIAATLCTGVAAALLAACAACAPARAEEPAKAAPDPAADEFRELRNLYRENPAKAADGFRAFLAKYPDGEWTDDAQYWLAMSLDRSRARRRDLLDAWQTLVDRFPQSAYVPDALFALAEVWQARAERPEDYTQAVKAYQTFLERCPTNARAGEALLRVGEIYDRVRNYDAAVAWFRRVIDEHPQSPFASRAHVALAAVYLKTDKPGDALALYEKLLQSELPEPQRVTARLGIVDCFLMRKDGLRTAIDTCAAIREEARQKKTLEDYAEFRTREKMAAWYLGRRKYVEAEAEYQAYLARFPKSEGATQARLGVGAIRLAAGKPAEAREMFHAVAAGAEPGAEKTPTHILRAMLSEAYTYEIEKNGPEAKALYRKLADSWPRTNEGREALKRLERLEKPEPPPTPDADKK